MLGGARGKEDRVSLLCHMPGERPEWHLRQGQLLSVDSQAQGVGPGQKAGIWLRRPSRRQSRIGLTQPWSLVEEGVSPSRGAGREARGSAILHLYHQGGGKGHLLSAAFQADVKASEGS